MIVKTLIKQLLEFPMDADVHIPSGDTFDSWINVTTFECEQCQETVVLLSPSS